MHKLGHPHALMHARVRAFRQCGFPNRATSTHCLMRPYTALPTPIPAPRCTEAESRMEQSRVRWQWHPSHAMNNQWTPSGAYNRGAQLQSFTPGCVSLSLCPTHCLSLFHRLSHLLSHPPFPTFPTDVNHYAATVSLSLIISSLSPSTWLCPVLPSHHPSPCSSVAPVTG